MISPNWDRRKSSVQVLNKWTSQGFDTFGGKLSRIVIVSLPNGYNGYYFNVHHSCMDSSSVIAFAKDVIEIYCSLLYGLPYPKPMTSYIESVKKDLEYPESKKAKRDEEYWHKQLDMPEPIYTDFTGPGRLIQLRRRKDNPNHRWGLLPTKDGDGNTITYELDVDSTKKIMDFAQKYDLPVSAVILHAIRTVLSKFNNNETDICIRDFVSRRSTLLNKKCGGVRMHCFPLRTIIEPTATVLESMEIINKAQQDVFLHADYSTMKYYYEERMRYNDGHGATYYSVSFTYQPGTRKGLMSLA